MLIPIGHESGTVRRHPLVTYAIMLACVGVFLWTNHSAGDQSRDSERLLQDAWDFLLEHPYLEPPPRFERLLGPYRENERLAALEQMDEYGLLDDLFDFEIEARQIELEEMLDEAFYALDDHPYHRYGLIARAPSLTGFFGYMFLHGGWMHLLGNLFLLFLTGTFIEDRWGRGLYAGFYLLAGLFAAGLFISRFPDLEMPLIGASGAVAGCMGAFLVRFWSTRIKFFYWLGFFVGTFHAPAWLMLPLWFGNEFFMASLTESLGVTGGTAYWAHVGGFLFGVVGAYCMRFWQVEERYLDPQIESKITLVSNEGVGEALALEAAGEREQAFEHLQRLVRREPGNREAAQALWDIGCSLGRAPEAAVGLVRVIRDELRAGDEALAVEHWLELFGADVEIPLEPAVVLRLFPLLVKAEHRDTGVAALNRLLDADALPAALALRIANTARRYDAATAVRAGQRVLAAPDVGPVERAEAESLLGEFGDVASLSVGADAAGSAESPDAGPAIELDQAVGVAGREAEAIALDEGPAPTGVEGSADALKALGLSAAESHDFGGPMDPAAFEGADDEAPVPVPEAFEDPGLSAHDLSDISLEGLCLDDEGEDDGPATEPLELGDHDGDLSGGTPEAEDWGNVELQEAPAEQAPPLRPLSLLEGVPVAIRADSLSLDVEGRGKTRLPFGHVSAVSVAAVKGLSPRTVLLVDLVLNWVDGSDAPLKVVRLRSDRFDPRALMKSEGTPLEALQALIAALLDGTGGSPLPDPQSVRGRPSFASFDAPEPYEREVLLARRADPA